MYIIDWLISFFRLSTLFVYLKPKYILDCRVNDVLKIVDFTNISPTAYISEDWNEFIHFQSVLTLKCT